MNANMLSETALSDCDVFLHAPDMAEICAESL